MSYLDDSLAHLEIFEGTVPWMYLDTKGFVTVGVGEMLANAAKAQALAFVDLGGQPSTQDAILAEFNRVSSLIPAKVAAFYRSSTSPVLSHAAIDTLLMNHLNFFDTQLSTRFAAYADFPDPAKLGLLDMIYNLGVTGLFKGFPHFIGCVDNQDWLDAAANCHRIGPSQVRNDWTRQQFLAAATAAAPAPTVLDSTPLASSKGG
jgi:GH24 family phage-related lysozyme (muramidase)